AGAYHGSHSPAFQSSSDRCSADADAVACSFSLASPFQHQPDGCSDEAVLYHGGRGSQRTVRCRRIHRSSAHHGFGDQSITRWLSFRSPKPDQPAVLYRWHAKGRLRLASLFLLSTTSPTGGAAPQLNGAPLCHDRAKQRCRLGPPDISSQCQVTPGYKLGI